MLDLLADFHFLRPAWLLGIVPVVGLWLALIRAQRQPPSWRRAIAPELLEHLVTKRADGSGFGSLTWIIPVGILGCLAMSGPTWKLADTPLGPDSSALIIAFELSESMDGRDVGPTRATRAKLKVRDLIEARGTGQTGLVAYAGSGHIVMPLTDDDRVILPYLDALSPELMPMPGDAPERAVPSIERMVAAADAPATIVLVTDGVPPSGQQALAALRERTKAELIIYAVGTDRGDPERGVAPIEETSLRRLANATDGTIVSLSLGDRDLRRILRIVDGHRRQSVSPDDTTVWEDAGYYVAFPFALMLLLWFRRGWVLRLPTAAAFLLSLAGCQSQGFVDLWWTPDQQGRLLFDRGDFRGAGEHFEDAMWKGIALYAAEDWPAASEAWSTVETPEGYFNLGNAYAQNHQWITAIQQYDKALELRPRFREARANRDLLQVALDTLQETSDTDELAKAPPAMADEAPVDLREDQKAPDDREPEDAFTEPERRAAASETLSEQTLQLWMRRVDTRPGEFLAQKFAAQAQEGGKP